MSEESQRIPRRFADADAQSQSIVAQLYNGQCVYKMCPGVSASLSHSRTFGTLGNISFICRIKDVTETFLRPATRDQRNRIALVHLTVSGAEHPEKNTAIFQGTQTNANGTCARASVPNMAGGHLFESGKQSISGTFECIYVCCYAMLCSTLCTHEQFSHIRSYLIWSEFPRAEICQPIL